jgi:hypothetical protein
VRLSGLEVLSLFLESLVCCSRNHASTSRIGFGYAPGAGASLIRD